jgi:hypothetical protein
MLAPDTEQPNTSRENRARRPSFWADLPSAFVHAGITVKSLSKRESTRHIFDMREAAIQIFRPFTQFVRRFDGTSQHADQTSDGEGKIKEAAHLCAKPREGFAF